MWKRKIRAPAGNLTLVVQVVTSCYTDSAIQLSSQRSKNDCTNFKANLNINILDLLDQVAVKLIGSCQEN
jgi:hypothetical protein